MLSIVVAVFGFLACQQLPKVTATSVAPSATMATPTTLTYAGPFTYAGAPTVTTYPNAVKILTNTAYLVGYDETRENPAWAAYRIPAERKFGTLPRPNQFSTDTRTTARVTHDDYTKTGFDRGHMVPNFAIASRFGETAQRETFVMSNVAPQAPAPALNQGPWRLLEETLAEKTAVNNEAIWIMVGPIYEEPLKTLPSGSVIPSAFFMVIADETPRGPRLAAFILPQTATRQFDFRTYRTTVQYVQLKTGLDFFWELPDAMETRLEAELGPYWLEALPGT
ncbi:MAG: DNA/RNA non-specific endonuclease [Opitutaceae bacterium]|nr:DNA/RNA non-specific endonuclease [Opitutaceae bacterium]